MKKYYLFHPRVQDYEVTSDVFENFISFLENSKDDRGISRYQVVTMVDWDRDPRSTYYYSWRISSDFTYLGHVSEDL